MFGEEFYPTPEKLLDCINEKIDIKWKEIKYVLEPSAGKGNIADWIKIDKKKWNSERNLDIDCIELNPDLRNVLKGKNYHVVFDNFLGFNTYKRYDLVIMNPPFSEGDIHLLKAIDLMENGGQILCILNAETIRNQCTNTRKVLFQKLFDLEAQIEYMEHTFSSAEKKTNVEIAVVYVSIPRKESKSDFLNDMKKKRYAEPPIFEKDEVAVSDEIANAVMQYNIDIECGIHLINEYQALKPRIRSSLNKEDRYAGPLMELKCGSWEATVNEYIKKIREKYWTAIFKNPRFTKGMTSNMLSEYSSKVNELVNFDFSEYNIRELQISMTQNLIRGIEECIISLFDELSRKFSYYDESSKNIHYYNGWKTNKSWIINKKVIIPFYGAYSNWGGGIDIYTVTEKLSDIEKVFRYLDGGREPYYSIYNRVQAAAEEEGKINKMKLGYFTITIYKKGTCHIEFTNEELLKKFNIFGSQQKGWLPPCYGKKKYEDMTTEEQAVIDDFQGKEEYDKVYANPDYYLIDSGSWGSVLGLEKAG